MPFKIETLQQFYTLMEGTKKAREKCVQQYLQNQSISSELITSLTEALEALEAIPQKEGKYSLLLSKTKTIFLDLSYEIGELKKDLLYLKHSPKTFYEYLSSIHSQFANQVQEGEKVLKGISWGNFITDRDGTINNYCGRYKSSIQSIYNSIFLTSFAQKCADHSVILTSAPLDKGGLVDISINPKQVFIYAGSKGREYLDSKGKRNQLSINKEEKNKLKTLNTMLTNLIAQPQYELFSLIGSGLQFKFGQTTISRQDIYHSIPAEESALFFEKVNNIVNEIDPEKEFFRLEDTGLDIEILLTMKRGERSKAFDKGDGVSFLNQELQLGLEKGPNLICGDTKSDVSMVAASMEKTPNTWGVFVTKDPSLQQEVKKICPQSLFVSEPDVLISILNNLSN